MVVKKNWLESFLPYFCESVVAVMGDNIAPKNISLNPIENEFIIEDKPALADLKYIIEL